MASKEWTQKAEIQIQIPDRPRWESLHEENRVRCLYGDGRGG